MSWQRFLQVYTQLAPMKYQCKCCRPIFSFSQDFFVPKVVPPWRMIIWKHPFLVTPGNFWRANSPWKTSEATEALSYILVFLKLKIEMPATTPKQGATKKQNELTNVQTWRCVFPSFCWRRAPALTIFFKASCKVLTSNLAGFVGFSPLASLGAPCAAQL